ncbi:MAG: hypothetical protein AAFY26_20915 [Cyanobacteria bacterium J06638_22]
MYESHIRFRRVAIAILAVFIVTDFWPHPTLSPGLILTALSKISAIAENVIMGE